jgi:hypothetical protein
MKPKTKKRNVKNRHQDGDGFKDLLKKIAKSPVIRKIASDLVNKSSDALVKKISGNGLKLAGAGKTGKTVKKTRKTPTKKRVGAGKTKKRRVGRPCLKH